MVQMSAIRRTFLGDLLSLRLNCVGGEAHSVRSRRATLQRQRGALPRHRYDAIASWTLALGPPASGVQEGVAFLARTSYFNNIVSMKIRLIQVRPGTRCPAESDTCLVTVGHHAP
jgi:hypothetical protein